MTAFSLGARLPLGANSALALSLPQSFVAAKRRQKPAPSSEGAEAATAAEHGGYLGEDRGAENAFNSPLWQHPIKMCAHGAHS